MTRKTFILKTIKSIFPVLIACLLGIGVFYFAGKTGKDKNLEVVVKNTNFEQLNHSTTNSDGEVSISSETILKVYTDKGVFEISQNGLYAHPELISMVNINDTIKVDWAWWDIPFIGMCRVITKIEK